jgi:broad specificity phosphatase PhoE
MGLLVSFERFVSYVLRSCGVGIFSLLATGVSNAKPIELKVETTRFGQGSVYFLRHAIAPGSGDPPDMRLDDPASQRNLSDTGRQQAVVIGDALRAAGVEDPLVYTSEWARCRETAELLGFGAPVATSGLNSFWERHETKGAVMAEFERLIEKLPEDGPPVIFVTHYVNIRAATGRAVGSGEGFWMDVEALKPTEAEAK